MSHFSVCVAIPATDLCGEVISRASIQFFAETILAPYDEQTENAAYLEFVDKTEEAQAEYENSSINGVPAKEVYATFEEYCRNFHEYLLTSNGRWGYHHNPNAKWDWFSLGGRFAGRLLVSSEAKFIVPCENSEKAAPDGYLWVDGAKKSAIAWDMMRAVALENERKHYDALALAYATGDLTPLDFGFRKDAEGIFDWDGFLVYKPGETYADYRARNGLADECEYAFHAYALVGLDGTWNGSGDMGWWGVSMNTKDRAAWNQDVQSFLNSLADDDFIVMLDCHI